MKSILLVSFLFLQVLSGYSQVAADNKAGATSKEKNSSSVATAGASSNLSAAPAYPGGNEAFAKFIRKNIKYPQAARDNKIQGQVTVRFQVDADGNVKNAKVPEGMGIGNGCDEEAVRVVMSSSKWTPGMRMGTRSDMW